MNIINSQVCLFAAVLSKSQSSTHAMYIRISHQLVIKHQNLFYFEQLNILNELRCCRTSKSQLGLRDQVLCVIKNNLLFCFPVLLHGIDGNKS